MIPFTKIKENRIYQRIADQILEAIFRGDLRPNDKLPSENKLSDMFGVSRVTVREAIRSLEQAGMVEVRQGSQGGSYIKKVELGSLVAQIGPALKTTNLTFPQLTEARALLEEMILKNLISSKINEAQLHSLERNVSVAEEHFRAKRNRERLVSNFHFHSLIVELTENPILILMHKLIVDLSLPFFENVKASTSMVLKTIEYHRAVVEHLKKGDFVKAGGTCAAHIRETSARIIEKSKKQSFLSDR